MARRSTFGQSIDEDLWEGYDNEKAVAPVPKEAKKKPTAAERRAAQAEKKVVTDRETKTAVRRRQRYEQQNPERFQSLQERLGTTATTKQIYMGRQWGQETQAESHLPRTYDRQLPGMEDPSAAPAIPRWEDLTPDKQTDIAARVKHKSGATIDSMSRAFGAQLDQAYMHAEATGVPRHASGELRLPGADFYHRGEPHQVIKKTAEEHDAPFGLVAAMHADLSPQTKFKDEAGRFPQDELARAALTHVQSGGDPHNPKRPAGAQGFQKNMVKASRRAHQVLYEGKAIPETTVGAKGRHGLGPKTSVYQRSWMTTEPDSFVADTHSGGGGMMPHLSSYKPQRVDEHGEPMWEMQTRRGKQVKVAVRDKSVREKALETAGVHSMIDFAARQALSERGLGNTRQAQAGQWNYERSVVRGYKSATPDVPSTPDLSRQFDPHQGKLF